MNIEEILHANLTDEQYSAVIDVPEIYCVWLAQDLENQGLWHIK